MPWVEHLANLIAHSVADEKRGDLPAEERYLERMLDQHATADPLGTYDPIAAELDALTDAGGDPFEVVNRSRS